MNRCPLIFAGIIFSIVAIVHLLRIIYHWPVIIGTWTVPMSVSVAALIVAAILAIWMFSAASNNKNSQ